MSAVRWAREPVPAAPAAGTVAATRPGAAAGGLPALGALAASARLAATAGLGGIRAAAASRLVAVGRAIAASLSTPERKPETLTELLEHHAFSIDEAVTLKARYAAQRDTRAPAPHKAVIRHIYARPNARMQMRKCAGCRHEREGKWHWEKSARRRAADHERELQVRGAHGDMHSRIHSALD